MCVNILFIFLLTHSSMLAPASSIVRAREGGISSAKISFILPLLHCFFLIIFIQFSTTFFLFLCGFITFFTLFQFFFYIFYTLLFVIIFYNLFKFSNKIISFLFFLEKQQYNKYSKFNCLLSIFSLLSNFIFFS